jgi:hypothetical protein
MRELSMKGGRSTSVHAPVGGEATTKRRAKSKGRKCVGQFGSAMERAGSRFLVALLRAE